MELEQAALLVVAEEKENSMREEETHERGHEREESKASGITSALRTSQEEHCEKCTASRESNVDAAQLTPEKSAVTLDFSELHNQPVAREQPGAQTLTASKQIQNLSAKLEKMLTLDPPVGLPTLCKPLIEEVPTPPPPPEEVPTPLPPPEEVPTPLPPPEQQDEGCPASSSCSTCSSSSSDSDTSSCENCTCEGPAD